MAHGEATGTIDSKEKRDEVNMSAIKENLEEKLTHVDDSGKASMVDVGAKPDTERVAEAVGTVKMLPSTLQLVKENSLEKGDVLAIAKIAGIMGAKQTSNLIPLCHPLPITHVDLSFEINSKDSAVEIKSMAKTQSKTGVEMEALTAVSIAALTIYDMCKAVDKGMEMSTKLLSKKGGRSGDVYLG